MNNLNNFLRRYNFEACIAPRKIWSLMESADYFATHLGRKESCPDRETALNKLLSVRNNLLTEMRISVEEGELVVNEVYLESDDPADEGNSVLDVEKSTVNPFIMINWALSKKIDVPTVFITYVDRKKLSKTAAYEYLGVKISTIHHERCRAIAELLWEIEPDMPIAQMACRREIIEIGCQGNIYDMRTISRWLATLKTDRRPGRISQNKLPTENMESDDGKRKKLVNRKK